MIEYKWVDPRDRLPDEKEGAVYYHEFDRSIKRFIYVIIIYDFHGIQKKEPAEYFVDEQKFRTLNGEFVTPALWVKLPSVKL